MWHANPICQSQTGHYESVVRKAVRQPGVALCTVSHRDRETLGKSGVCALMPLSTSMAIPCATRYPSKWAYMDSNHGPRRYQKPTCSREKPEIPRCFRIFYHRNGTLQSLSLNCILSRRIAVFWKWAELKSGRLPVSRVRAGEGPFSTRLSGQQHPPAVFARFAVRDRVR